MPGHEKHPSEAYLDQRGVSAVVLHSRPRRSLGIDVAEYPKARLYLSLRYYDPAVLAALQRAGWKVPEIGEARTMAGRVAAEAPCEIAGKLLERIEGLLRAGAEDGARREWRVTLAERCEGGPRATP